MTAPTLFAIELGASQVRVARYGDHGAPELVKWLSGEDAMPTSVWFSRQGAVAVNRKK